MLLCQAESLKRLIKFPNKYIYCPSAAASAKKITHFFYGDAIMIRRNTLRMD